MSMGLSENVTGAPEVPGRILAASSALFKARHLDIEPAARVAAALSSDRVATRVLSKGARPESGARIGVRLNINIARSTGVCVHSIHRGTASKGYQQGRGFFRGEVLTYLQVVTLRHAFFNVHQASREAIAAGTMTKAPMASVDGEFVSACRVSDFSGIEVRFNPKREHLFVDPEDFAIRYAEEVTLYGNRAYARGLVAYHDAQSAPARAGGCPTRARLRPAATRSAASRSAHAPRTMDAVAFAE